MHALLKSFSELHLTLGWIRLKCTCEHSNHVFGDAKFEYMCIWRNLDSTCMAKSSLTNFVSLVQKGFHYHLK